MFCIPHPLPGAVFPRFAAGDRLNPRVRKTVTLQGLTLPEPAIKGEATVFVRRLVSFFALLCATMTAQEFRATISGHVLDASGAAIPNAKIQAVNTATNETTSATSDNSGAYSIPFLRPGNYRLTGTAQGFKQFVRTDVVLEAAKVAGIDIILEVGAITES